MTSRTPRPPRRYASPPCLACEIDPTYFDPLGVDPQQARDVAQWRKSERKRLVAARRAMAGEDRRRIGLAIAEHLRALLQGSFGGGYGRVLSGYWPIKAEPDLRQLLTELHASGVTLALPVVEARGRPLIFRRWTPDTKMIRGFWDIPVPPPESVEVAPDIVLAPLVGWDRQAYRLGYGGGYFDRTLAAMAPRPASIGVGYASSLVSTIFPQPHDIPLDFILTERGVEVADGQA
jgi:5-formyltetrahydrofolate cyclo-ligase